MSFSGIHNLHVLRHETMTDLVRKFPSTGAHWFYENLYRPRPKKLIGTDIAVWDEVSRSRKRAPYNARGAPAQRMDTLRHSTRTSSVADIFVSKHLTAHQIEYLRQYGTQNQEGARQLIADELEDLIAMVHNTREHACLNTTLGAYSVDQSAGTKVKSKGVRFSLTFPVTTLTAAASWATAGTKIYTTEIDRIFEKMIDVTGDIPSFAVHNLSVMTNLLQNTEVKEFLGESYKTQLLKEGRIGTIRNINWNQYDTGDDDSGSWVKYLPNERIIFLPEDRRYFEIHEADALIPTPDGRGLQRTSPGIYSYSRVTDNPAGIELFVGYRFLAVNRYAEKTLIFDTTP